jgi:hypothetical protein
MQHRVRLVTFNITPSPDDLRTSGLDQAPVQQAISGRVQGYLLSGVWAAGRCYIWGGDCQGRIGVYPF